MYSWKYIDKGCGYLGLDLLVRLDGARFAHHHAPPHVLPLEATHQGAQVVTGLGPVQRLVEHLHPWQEHSHQH